MTQIDIGHEKSSAKVAKAAVSMEPQERGPPALSLRRCLATFECSLCAMQQPSFLSASRAVLWRYLNRAKSELLHGTNKRA